MAYPWGANLLCILALHPFNSEFLTFNPVQKANINDQTGFWTWRIQVLVLLRIYILWWAV
jgi:hypothetical protein